jgi:hypothetical protein
VSEEQTCGQEMASSAEVPRLLQALMNHVAANMEWHAQWVGARSTPARRERDGLLRVAREYRAMAAAADRAATAMNAMNGLAPAPHDAARFDRAGQARWMQAKIRMQRELAAMLERHARDSEKALAGM